MTLEQIVWATTVAVVLVAFTYYQTGFNKIKESYGMWFTKDYWSHFYNKVEADSLTAKDIIIIQ
jgi:uncharacterized membrane protein (DUF2068 family)